MPIQPYRTRKLRRVKVKIPAGVKTHYRKRKPKKAHCSKCQKPLGGVPRDLPYKIRQLPKTKRRPERMYAGVLCPSCLKKHLENLHLKKSYELEVGRLCMKTSGREAGKYCVIVDKKDNKFVIIDGQVKRRRCSINHLISLEPKITIKKNAPTSEVIKKLKTIKIEVVSKKSKKQKPKPKKQRKQEKPKEVKKKVEKKKEVKTKKAKKK